MLKKPELRVNARYNFRSAINGFVETIFSDARSYPFQTCLNCDHWDDKEEICKKFSARPPAHIIVFSCPDYDDMNDIPF